jgi:DNA-binding GntR family transcriptional regulator
LLETGVAAAYDSDMSDIKPPGGTVSTRIGATVRSRAVEELRNRVLTDRLPAGERVDLDGLAAEFGTSRTPVREALLELSYEGLVVVSPRSGITVVGLSPQDAVDNFAVLALLAGKAAEWATERHTPAELDELRDLADDIAEADDVVAANRAFHRAVNRCSRSPRLLIHLRQAARIVPTNYFQLFPEQRSRSQHEHAALLDAMAAGDAAAAGRLAEAHVLTAGEALGDWLQRTRER